MAQWVAALVTLESIHRDNIYAGVYTNIILRDQTYEGIFKSTDNGESWTKLNTGIDQFEVYAVYINKQDHIYVGTNYGNRTLPINR